jgi:hypothetical protein
MTPVILDHRQPGRPMVPVPLKLSLDLMGSLELQADRARTSRTGLARHLIAVGLAQLEQQLEQEQTA